MDHGHVNVADFSNLKLGTESDVEQKLVYPILVGDLWLRIHQSAIKTKEYLPPTDLDKGSGKRKGYFPDYSVWYKGLPILIVEAKSPKESTEEGFKEAQLYAHALNSRYSSGINPAKFVIATNGTELLYGTWDCATPVALKIKSLAVGNAVTESFKSFLHADVLNDLAENLSRDLRQGRYWKPIDFLGGQPRLMQKISFNSFAEDLVPLITMYFDSESPAQFQEVLKRAYVASDELTKYERLFETYLRERSPTSHDPGAKVLAPTKTNEKLVTEEIRDYSVNLPQFGKTQLIIGAVGTGKSIFTQRYYHHLQSDDLKRRTYWSFIDFNEAPANLDALELWVAEKFIEGLAKNPTLVEIYDHAILLKIFGPEIKKVAGAYRYLKDNDVLEYNRRLASDLRNWLSDKILFAHSVCRFLIGDQRFVVVIVFDNVDRRDREQQLRIFQVAEWFKSQTRSFCLINLRDETYERFKNEPPLDAFQNSIHFYIAPPRFADVVKRRLELALEYLTANAGDKLTYSIATGASITYPATRLGQYLKSLYVDLFRSNRNITRVLEAVAGRNVRQALEMFTRLIMSGHLDERAITRTILKKDDSYHIPEAAVIKILMRTDYRYFDDSHGFLANIFGLPKDIERPNNFLLIECLQFLLYRRKWQGDIRIEGYFLVSSVISYLERGGFTPKDVTYALEFLLGKGLIVADHMRKNGLTEKDCVKIHASGAVHMMMLVNRLEYVSGCLPVVPIFDQKLSKKLSSLLDIQSRRNDISLKNKKQAVILFLDYLRSQYASLERQFPFFSEIAIGSRGIISKIQETVDWQTSDQQEIQTPNLLDRLDT